MFLSGLRLAENLPQMALLSERLRAEPSIEHVDSWYDEFQFYVNYNQYGGKRHRCTSAFVNGLYLEVSNVTSKTPSVGAIANLTKA